MDDVKLGRVIRALRRRRGWRQCDLAARAGCSQTAISFIERGHVDRLSVRRMRGVAAALDARFEGVLSWRGCELDRLLDARHASLVETAADRYRRLGWDVHVEVTYSRYGERGAIDLLAVRPNLRAAAVNEIKSEIGALEELNRRLDQKVRLAGEICHERFGWRPTAVARVLVVPDDRTIRRIIAAHRRTFAATYWANALEFRGWLANPTGHVSAIWFLSASSPGNARRVRTGTRREAPRDSCSSRRGTPPASDSD